MPIAKKDFSRERASKEALLSFLKRAFFFRDLFCLFDQTYFGLDLVFAEMAVTPNIKAPLDNLQRGFLLVESERAILLRLLLQFP